MSNEHNSIHDFDVNLICEYYSAVKRQGPGSEQVTKQALHFIDNLTKNSQIVDLGCGTGGQTLVLAQHTPGSITGIDLFPKFIDIFNQNAKLLALQDRVKGKIGSMDALDFAPASLDLIWSEGAIYNIGYERGLNEWRSYLKQGGYVAVSEASWFTDERPAEINDFWLDAYPEIDTIPCKIGQMQKAGYVPVASFILPENCWIDHFYVPQEEVQESFLARYPNNKMAQYLVAEQRREAELYYKYKAYYGYVFYIGKKI